MYGILTDYCKVNKIIGGKINFDHSSKKIKAK